MEMQLESAEKGRPEKESEREERNTTNKLLERKQEENKSDEPTDYKTNKSVDPLDKITNKMTGKNQVEAKIPEKSKSGKDHEEFMKNINDSIDELTKILKRIIKKTEDAHCVSIELKIHESTKYYHDLDQIYTSKEYRGKIDNEERRLQDLLEAKEQIRDSYIIRFDRCISIIQINSKKMRDLLEQKEEPDKK